MPPLGAHDVRIPPFASACSWLWNRREFLVAGSGALAAWPWLAAPASAAYRRQIKLKDYPFKLGVASGDPAGRFVLRTCRAELLAGGGMPQENIEVSWQVADDEQMTKVLAEGKAVAGPELADSVHVEGGGLAAGSLVLVPVLGSGRSQSGRPSSHCAAAGLRLNPSGCGSPSPRAQHYEQGLFTA